MLVQAAKDRLLGQELSEHTEVFELMENEASGP